MRLSILLPVFFLASCYFDATPPEESELHDDGPVLAFRANGFKPGAAVRVSWTESGQPMVSADGRYSADAGGRVAFTLVLAKGTASTVLVVTVDGDGDGEFSTGDKQFMETVPLEDEKTKNVIKTYSEFSAI